MAQVGTRDGDRSNRYRGVGGIAQRDRLGSRCQVQSLIGEHERCRRQAVCRDHGVARRFLPHIPCRVSRCNDEALCARRRRRDSAALSQRTNTTLDRTEGIGARIGRVYLAVEQVFLTARGRCDSHRRSGSVNHERRALLD